ncbi:hypothetical protein [Bradyrhizobium iriomotense]|uniref:hypothetical protein n=1 Tax=Bradyrhizobium iriomotense TaxID=441950 RepID=UPI001B8A0542|nr:hypothetical protein [Bradyrhizobium iriomotense]MBR1133081.1 hypothetical protein [Bradyrhizobium iriomotense]
MSIKHSDSAAIANPARQAKAERQSITLDGMMPPISNLQRLLYVASVKILSQALLIPANRSKAMRPYGHRAAETVRAATIALSGAIKCHVAVCLSAFDLAAPALEGFAGLCSA